MKKNESYITNNNCLHSPTNKYGFVTPSPHSTSKKPASRVHSTSSTSSQKQFYYSDGEEDDKADDDDGASINNAQERPASENEDEDDIEFSSNLLRRPRPMSFPYALNEPPDNFADYR